MYVPVFIRCILPLFLCLQCTPNSLIDQILITIYLCCFKQLFVCLFVYTHLVGIVIVSYFSLMVIWLERGERREEREFQTLSIRIFLGGSYFISELEIDSMTQ